MIEFEFDKCAVRTDCEKEWEEWLLAVVVCTSLGEFLEFSSESSSKHIFAW